MTTNAKELNGSFIEEQNDPQNDPRGFRRTLGQFATGVTVVTTSTENGPVGMAVNSFAAVSLDPPLVSWSIRNESKNLKSFTEGNHFAISVLAADQVEVCSIFGRPQDGQFDLVPWSKSVHGDPLIGQALAHFECTVEEVVPGGDHQILIGRVQKFTRFSGEPLLFAQGQYKAAVEHPQLANTAASEASSNGIPSTDDEPLFVSLLKSTEQFLSDKFGEHREMLGVDAAETRVINLLDQNPYNVSQLAVAALMRTDAVEDTLADLGTKGLAVKDASGFFDLTDKGRKTRSALLASATAFNAQLLELVDEDDLKIARQVLMRILTS